MRALVASLSLIVSAGCGMNDQRIQAGEMAAIQRLRTIHMAETQYYSQYERYAPSLRELGPSSSGPAGPNSAGLIDAGLASGTKAGYIFRVSARAKGYEITAKPEQPGVTGRRSFYSDETMVTHQSSDGEATAGSPELK